MNAPIKDGGPAFPSPIAGCTDGSVYNVFEQSRGQLGGMTLRDYFAARAMQGDWAAQSNELGYFTVESNTELLMSSAKLYYRMADAMLRAREAKS